MLFKVYAFILTQSRGGWICLLTYIAIYLLFIKKYNFKETKQALKWCYKAVVTAVLCVVVIAGGNLLKTGLGYIPVAIEEMAELTQALTKYLRISQGGQLH